MIKGGPRVVTDGLVLCLDAHDAKSYAGEPVTNLASGSWYTWVNSGAWTQNTYTTHESCPVGFPPGLKGVSGVQVLEGICTTTGSIHFGTGHVNPASASTQYTYSVWFYQKGRAGIGAPYARANVSNTNLGTMKYNGTTGSSNWPVNKWIKLEITFTTQSSDTQTYISNYIGSQVGDTMYFCAPQAEQKSYYSPYASSSRSATNGWVDRSGNSNSGTLTNMVGTGASHYRDGQVIMPVSAGYLRFDGSNDQVIISQNSSINLSTNAPYTLEYWVSFNYLTSTDFAATIMKGSFTTSYGHLFIKNTNDANTRILVYTDDDSSPELTVDYPISTATWYHIVQTFSSGTAKLYVNGELEGSASGLTATSNTSDLRLGSNAGSNYFMNGDLAKVNIYNIALTDAQVLSNYNATKGRFS